MSDESVSPGEAAKEEAARQLVMLAFGVAAVLASIWVQRAAAGPDMGRSWRMRLAKASERAHARLAAWAWRQAESARKAYDQESA